MLTLYHEAITRKALKRQFSPPALEEIVAANLKQDNLRGQIGHDEYHFDNNAFEASYAFIEEQRRLVYASLKNGDLPIARAAFGSLTHTAQDFYAHSNYVDMWLAQFSGSDDDDGNLLPPTEIDPLVDELIHNPGLHSGRLYYPLEVFAFLPLVKNFVIPLLPKDSHAHMNLDSPRRGIRFAYAFEAAVKRTRIELAIIQTGLSSEVLTLFYGYPEETNGT